MNKPGKIVTHFLPLLLGFILLISLLAVHFNWFSVGLAPSPVNAEAVLSPSRGEISLSSSHRGREDRRNFTRGEKIYARAQLQRVTPGDHTVSFYWINPRGEIQETYKKSFSPRRGRYNCWSWLELKGADWFPVSIGPFGPAKFRGRWRVRVALDGKLLAENEFIVE